ncbi:MAG: MaoC family dehydratase N-terminal domain-containing protein [Dehalococcoidia bacterium]
MAEDSLFEEAKKLLGVESEPITYDVEKGHIQRFAEAIEDPNPLWQDEAEASRTPYGGVVAPPTFARAFLDRSEDDSLSSAARVLDGGSQWEYYGPVKVGDRITVTSKLADLFQKEGRLGTMTFHIREITFTNQNGEVVVKRRDTSITY